MRRILSRVPPKFQLPGFVDAHCHAFQRALRGRTEGRDFWAWRDVMLDVAGNLDADEQPREIEECVAEHGLRPIELLAECGCLGPRTTIVHATHADGHELDLLGEAGARICACPTTEANLGDGFLPVERVMHRGIRLCIGSDSNVRIDPFEELRELDGIARRQSGRRDVLSVDALLSIGSDAGAAALGLEQWPQIEIDTAHPQLEGVADPRTALVHSCSADVVSSGG